MINKYLKLFFSHLYNLVYYIYHKIIFILKNRIFKIFIFIFIIIILFVGRNKHFFLEKLFIFNNIIIKYIFGVLKKRYPYLSTNRKYFNKWNQHDVMNQIFKRSYFNRLFNSGFNLKIFYKASPYWPIYYKNLELRWVILAVYDKKSKLFSVQLLDSEKLFGHLIKLHSLNEPTIIKNAYKCIAKFFTLTVDNQTLESLGQKIPIPGSLKRWRILSLTEEAKKGLGINMDINTYFITDLSISQILDKNYLNFIHKWNCFSPSIKLTKAFLKCSVPLFNTTIQKVDDGANKQTETDSLINLITRTKKIFGSSPFSSVSGLSWRVLLYEFGYTRYLLILFFKIVILPNITISTFIFFLIIMNIFWIYILFFPKKLYLNFKSKINNFYIKFKNFLFK